MRRPSIRRNRRLISAAPRPPTPLSIFGANLRLWLRADQGITIATGVSQWNDLSGNNFHATQGTGSAQPSVTANWKNGRPGITCNAAASQFMSGVAANLITGDWTLFVVGSKVNNPDSVSYNDKWFEFVGAQGHRALTVLVGAQRYVATLTADTTCSTAFNIGTSPAYISWAAVNSGVPQVRCNGVAMTTAVARPATSGITGYQIGGTNTNFLDGTIGEVIAVNAAASAAQIAVTEAYIRRFWNFP